VQTIGADPGVAQAFGFTRGTLVAADQSGEVLEPFGIDHVGRAAPLANGRQGVPPGPTLLATRLGPAS
jgi:hypothetical protein